MGFRSRFLLGLLVALVMPAEAGAFVYWANYGDGTTQTADGVGSSIGRAENDGSRVISRYVGGARYPCGVAVDPQFVWWANFGATSAGPGTASIGRASLAAPSTPTVDFARGASYPCGVAV